MNSLLIAGNILKRTFKSPKLVISMIVFPIALIFVIVIALRETPASAPKAGVVNLDGGAFAAAFGELLEKQKVELVDLDGDSYLSAVKSGKVSFAVVLPENFTRDIRNGQRVEVNFYSKGNSSSLQSVKEAADTLLADLYSAGRAAAMLADRTGADRTKLMDGILERSGSRPAEVEYRRAGPEPDASDNEIVSPATGFAIMFMMILIFTTIGTILEDKKRLTLARMYVSPVREWEIIAGNVLGSLALGVVQLLPLVLALKICFNIGSAYKIAGIFLVLLCFLISVIGIGIGISGIIKNSFNPTTIIAAVVMPSCILGGCFIPESMLPDAMNKLGYIVPQKWTMDALQSILAGGGIGSVAFNLVIVLLIGITAATFGLKTLKPLND